MIRERRVFATIGDEADGRKAMTIGPERSPIDRDLSPVFHPSMSRVFVFNEVLPKTRPAAAGIFRGWAQRGAEVFAEDYDMIDASPPDRADQPFRAGVLPG
jgi:hypothetical protein